MDASAHWAQAMAWSGDVLVASSRPQEALSEQNALIQRHSEQMSRLSEQVKALQDRLAKDSHNSHLPPSSEEQEVAVVREHYAATSKLELMALLPHRGWHAIRAFGEKRLKIARRQGKLTDSEKMMIGLDLCSSYSDMEFIQSKGISPSARSTNWERFYSRS